MNIQTRHNVQVTSDGPITIVFAHGFGFDQTIWQYFAKFFAVRYRLILFDLVGSGQSAVAEYDFERHGTLYAHADDLLEVLAEYCREPVIFIGHSVGSTIGMLASIKAAHLFRALVMLAPSPKLVNDRDYIGGFERSDIESLLESLESNYLGWSSAMAPTILGMKAANDSADFARGFCCNDPEIGKHFARVTFLADHRADLASVTTPTLIVQASNDPFVPTVVGEQMRNMIRGSQLAAVQCTGHCPHITAPQASIAAIEAFLNTIAMNEDGRSKENLSVR